MPTTSALGLAPCGVNANSRIPNAIDVFIAAPSHRTVGQTTVLPRLYHGIVARRKDNGYTPGPNKENTMAKITLKGNPVTTVGTLPAVGQKAPEFKLAKSDLSNVSLTDFQGKKVVLNIFPSIDTGVCATSVRKFNQEAANLSGAVVVGV